MKTMTCKQLGGACHLEFGASASEEMARQSQQQGKEMYEKGHAAHLKAMQEMNSIMAQPGSLEKWIVDKRKEFDDLPET